MAPGVTHQSKPTSYMKKLLEKKRQGTSYHRSKHKLLRMRYHSTPPSARPTLQIPQCTPCNGENRHIQTRIISSRGPAKVFKNPHPPSEAFSLQYTGKVTIALPDRRRTPFDAGSFHHSTFARALPAADTSKTIDSLEERAGDSTQWDRYIPQWRG